MKQKPITDWDTVPVITDLAMAGRVLGLNPDYLRQLSKRGRFPAFKPPGTKAWRVYKEDLQSLKERSTRNERNIEKSSQG